MRFIFSINVYNGEEKVKKMKTMFSEKFNFYFFNQYYYWFVGMPFFREPQTR